MFPPRPAPDDQAGLAEKRESRCEFRYGKACGISPQQSERLPLMPNGSLGLLPAGGMGDWGQPAVALSKFTSLHIVPKFFE